MPYDIGPRIGITGEKEFNKQIRSIHNNIKLLGSEMNLLSKEYEDNADSIEFLSKKNDLLTSELKEQQSKLSLLDEQYTKQNKTLEVLKKELADTTEAFGKNSIEAAKAENAVRKQEEILSKLGISINSTKGYIVSLNSQIASNTDKIRELSSANEHTESSLGKLTNTIASQEKELNELQTAYKEAVLSKGKDSEETKRLADQITRLSTELKQNKDTVSQVEKESRQLASALDDVDDKAKDAGEGFTVMKGALAGITSDGIQSLGDELKEVVTQSDNANAQFMAMTGESVEEMKKYNKQIEELYDDNFGDSMEELATSMAKVKQQIKGLNEESLSNVTAGLLTLEDTFEMDFNETLRGTRQLMYQFGLDAEDALDLIAKGAQSGLNYTDELGDNISEYSGKFSQAGYSAEEYFQLLANGSDNGAYNLDKINDAINEVTTRLADGTIEDSLDMFNEDTQKVFRTWQKGGASQKDVIDAIVKDIKETTNEQEKLTKASEAFGTMGEDANTKFVESLTSVGNEFEDVSGKMKEINKIKYDTVESKLKGLGRTFQTDIAGPIVEDALPVLESGVEWLSDNIPLVENTVKTLGIAMASTFAVKKTVDFKNSIVDIGEKLVDLGTNKTSVVANGLSTIGGLLTSNPWGVAIGGVAALGTALIAFSQQEDEASRALRENAEQAEKNIDTYNEMRDATGKQIQDAQSQFAYYERLKSELESITSENGKVKEGYEQRANFIINELNNALGTEITMTNNIIDKYEEQMGTLDKLIEKQRAKAFIDANQDDYQTAVKNQTQALQDMLEAEETYAAEKKRIEEEIAEYNRNNWDESMRLQNERLAWQDKDYLNAKSNYENKKKLAEGYTQTIAEQEYLLQLYADGSAKSLDAINSFVSSSYDENGKKVQLSLEQMISIEEQKIAMLKNSNNEASKIQLEASEKRLSSLKEELAKQNETVTNSSDSNKTAWEKYSSEGLKGFSNNKEDYYRAAFEQVDRAKDGINDGTEPTKKAWKALADAGYAVLDGKTWKYTAAGANYAIGLKSGIEENSGSVFSAVANMGNTMISVLMNSLDEHSPSKESEKAGDFFTLGAVKGVEKNKKKAISAVKDLGDSMIYEMKNWKSMSLDTVQDAFSINGTMLSNTKAVFESKNQVTVPVYLDGRIIAQSTTSYITRSQSTKSVMKGGN